MVTAILLFVLGLALLVKGADWLVDGASLLAKRFKVSDLAIGLTIVAFGTSAPELVVNSIASFQNHQDIVFSNVIGSNILNLFIILGITGLVIPLTVQSSTVWKEVPLSLVAIIFLFVLVNYFGSSHTPALTRLEGIFLLILFALFIYYVYKQLKIDTAEQLLPEKSYRPLKMWGFILLGFAGLIIGGWLVVTNAVKMAVSWGVSEKIIGLTIVAAGTSVSELATSIVAAIKKNDDIAVGNIVGSNIFNIFFILAISSLIRPISYDTSFNTDLFFLAGGTIFLFMAMFTGRRNKLDRWEAALLLMGYIGYTAFLVQREI